MKLYLTEDQVKEAVVKYLNDADFLKNVKVEKAHVKIKMRSEGQYEDCEKFFDGVVVDINPKPNSAK